MEIHDIIILFLLVQKFQDDFFWTELLPLPLQMKEAWQHGAHALCDHTQWELNGGSPLRLRMGPRV